MKVMVALSGGVDSAVTALLLKDEGHRVEALFMKNWEEDDREGYCAAATDLKDAEAVCANLGIALHTVNFSHEYWDSVFEHFLAEYRAGRTPNPDVLCNREIKFKAFWQHARSMDVEQMATGHYAAVSPGAGGYFELHTCADIAKDQTYFLYALSQAQLAHAMFPLSALKKAEVRRLAREAHLPVHDKKDSTGICFIGERRFRDFLAQYLPAQPGDIISSAGRKLGEHQGLMYYTLGQRQGIGLGGRSDAAALPWYVAEKDLAGNRLVVVQGPDHPALFRQRLTAGQLSWIAGHPPDETFSCEAKTRYRQAAQACKVTLAEAQAEVVFQQAQRAPTPGQSLVFYQGTRCLGGGIIESAA